MAKKRCKLRTKMWGPPNQRQRAFNGQAPDGKGGYLRKRDKLPPVASKGLIAEAVRQINALTPEQIDRLTAPEVTCESCHQRSPDEGQRCCPKCRCPGWRGERVIENYPAQEGVKGCACGERSFLEKVVREG